MRASANCRDHAPLDVEARECTAMLCNAEKLRIIGTGAAASSACTTRYAGQPAEAGDSPRLISNCTTVRVD